MRVAIRPLRLPSNSYVGRFSAAISSLGHDVTDFKDSLRAMSRLDVTILHWPNEFLAKRGLRRALLRLAKIRMARLFGMKLVWVAHNRAAHDKRAAHSALTRAFFNSLDGIIYLSSASKAIIRATYPVHPRTTECVTVHGWYPPVVRAADFIRPSHDQTVQLASYGLIRPYKNFQELAELVSRMEGVTLDVFGQGTDRNTAAAIDEIAALASNVRTEFTDEPFSDPELERRIDRAHGVVLPYLDVLNSGAALQALSRNRPVLLPAIGSLPELQRMVGPLWVHLYEGTLNQVEVTRFCAALRRLPETRPGLAAYEWSRVAMDLRKFFRDLQRPPA